MMLGITYNGWIQILLFFGILFAASKPLGVFMASVYQGQKTILSAPLGWLEKIIYKVCFVKTDEDMTWKQYASHVVIFSTFSLFGLYAILRLQASLPLNPANMGAVAPDLAFNTAISFVSNTNWQSYGGEATMSYFTQMVGLSMQNFVSAAVGMAVMAAVVRGFVLKSSKTIGNFWVDMVRGLVYILLPLCLILATVLVWQGVPQTFKPYAESQLVEQLSGADGKTVTTQNIAIGLVASQIAIKQLGTNGGGYYNANSSHPLENPTPLSNFLQLLAIVLIPAACCHAFGRMVGDARQGWALLAAMTVIFVPLALFGVTQEQAGNPMLAKLGDINQSAYALQSGGNMEGKETRFGIVNSALWAAATTAASNGSVNSMHDSYTPLGGMVPLLLMQFSEVIYGGVGCGLYGMLVYALITVFIAGLMVGRTPEYLGKKVQAYEIKMASLVLLAPLLAVLLGTALAVVTEAGKAGVLNTGPHAFSEILYAFTSAGNNNGSAFAGLTAATPFYDTALGWAMLVSRFFCMLPVLAIAGSMAAKKSVPASSGTLPTHTPLFIALLAGVVVLVGVLTYVPALALGPVAEHLEILKSLAE
jgi:K+-transporting ATPase ATPase A chain